MDKHLHAVETVPDTPTIVCAMKPGDHVPCFDSEINKAMLDHAEAMVTAIQEIVEDIVEVKAQLAATMDLLNERLADIKPGTQNAPATDIKPDTYQDVI